MLRLVSVYYLPSKGSELKNNAGTNAGEANIAKFIFKMVLYADIIREQLQYGCGL